VNTISFERINLLGQESIRAERSGRFTKLCARWQSGVKTLSGYGLPKLRLEFASSAPQTSADLNQQEQ